MEQKTALITGASRGIGRACALSFARLGYHVFINSCHSETHLKELQQLIIEKGGTCTAIVADVSKSSEVNRVFDVITSKCNGLDVLVNNAGISYIGLLTDMTDLDWDSIIGTNLSSAFYCSRAAIPHMVSKKSGKIINISSMWGTTGASCEVAYSASKSGLNGLTKALAKELAPSNIQVNAIACGVIDTAMNSCFTDDEKKSLEDEIPMGRFGLPNEVADLVIDLAENHPYMTGQILGLDGGFI